MCARVCACARARPLCSNFSFEMNAWSIAIVTGYVLIANSNFVVCLPVTRTTAQAGGLAMLAFSLYLFMACQTSRLYSDVWVR